MQNCIMTGCDLHDKTMLLKIARGRGEPEKRSFRNTLYGRAAMVKDLKRRSQAAAGAKVVFAYEASGQGFGLYDELTEAGFECYVLAPTRIARSVKQRRDKTDEKDANRLLELLRGHILAGNELPAVWVPDPETRDDRELVRARLEVGEKLARVKAQIQSLLKRNGIRKPASVGGSWTHKHRIWLRELAKAEDEWGDGARLALGSLLRQMEPLEQEIVILDEEITRLAQTERYKVQAEELDKLKGVGLLTAMVFLTEMGDLNRFSNRRQVASFLGLVPSSNESGEKTDRKGHITHQGPSRVRKVLCQATWACIRSDAEARLAYDRVVRKNPKHKKIAVVAGMRHLSIRMWHRAVAAKEQGGDCREPSAETLGGGGPDRPARLRRRISDELTGPILDTPPIRARRSSVHL